MAKKSKKSKKSKKKKDFMGKIKARQKGLLARRTHRSFKLTRHRDYSVKLPMPGYTSFTVEVFGFLLKNLKIFLTLAAIGIILFLWSASFMAQDNYLELVAQLRNAVQTVVGEPLTLFGESGTLLMSIFFRGVHESDATNPYAVLAIILIWLTSVWLVRNIVAGKKVTTRQAVYNSGAPIVSSGLVLLMGLLQASPAIIAFGIYPLAQQSGVMDQGVVAMGISIGLFGLVVLSLYWITSTLIALVIVTLPNMYPMRAVSLAGDLVSGIRLKILYRILWMSFILVIIWAIILGSAITIDILLRNWFEWFMNIPFVPMVMMVLSVLSLIFICVYIYLLYIKLVEARHEKIN